MWFSSGIWGQQAIRAITHSPPTASNLLPTFRPRWKISIHSPELGAMRLRDLGGVTGEILAEARALRGPGLSEFIGEALEKRNAGQ